MTFRPVQQAGGVGLLAVLFALGCSQTPSLCLESEEVAAYVPLSPPREIHILTINVWSGLTYEGTFTMGRYPDDLEGGGLVTNGCCLHFGEVTQAMLGRSFVNGKPLYVYAVHLHAGPYHGPALDTAKGHLADGGWIDSFLLANPESDGATWHPPSQPEHPSPDSFGNGVASHSLREAVPPP